MADIAAPYFSGTELTGQPGDAALGGVKVNFNPANQNPLAPIDAAISTATKANDELLQQKQQQRASLLQQQRQFDQQMRMEKVRQQYGDRQRIANFFDSTGVTTGNVRGEKGEDAAIGFLPQDYDQLTSETNALSKKSFADPSGFGYSPEFAETNRDLGYKRRNASMRKVYYDQAQQYLSNTADPDEQKRTQDYLDKYKDLPLTAKDVPYPFVPAHVFAPLIDREKYFKDDNTESFKGDQIGVPNAAYRNLETTTNPALINEGYQHLNIFKKSPVAKDPDAYIAYQDEVNKLRSQRGQPYLDLGGTMQNGQLVIDDSTPEKAEQLAKNHLTAYHLMSTGQLQDDPDAEEDKAKLEHLKAQTAKEYADAEKARRTTDKKTTEELKDELNKKSAESMYNEVNGVFQDAFNKQKESATYPDYWKKNGIDPAKYDIYPSITGGKADKFIGIPHPEVSTTTPGANGVKTITKSTEPSLIPDRITPIKDKDTEEEKLAYWKDGKIQAIVTKKQSTINGLKHEGSYEPKNYENRTPWVDGLFSKVINGKTYEKIDGKWHEKI